VKNRGVGWGFEVEEGGESEREVDKNSESGRQANAGINRQAVMGKLGKGEP